MQEICRIDWYNRNSRRLGTLENLFAMRSAALPPIIALTTDFGLTDTYVGVMKGVILGIVPQARLIDVTHAITPQNILEASLRLASACPYFPAGTLHLVVVDPGVGSDRAAVVVQTETSLFVAPDNGVLTLPLRRTPPRRIVRLGEAARAFCRHPVSATFHGRDLFAPIAAHLAAGLPLEALEDREEAGTLVELALSEPQPEQDAVGRPRLRLHVLYIDHFGNLITDLTPERWDAWQQEAACEDPEDLSTRTEIQIGEARWRGILRTFADVAAGSPLAYWGSAGYLEVAVRNGNAARTFGLSPGATLLLTG
jgi:S-adenosylmethionine hydrolase